MLTGQVVLPKLQLLAGLFLLASFLLLTLRYLLGFSVLDDWNFFIMTGLVSLGPAMLILLVIYRSASYKNCSWRQKFPFVTLLLVSEILIGSLMIFNTTGYFMNKLLPAQDSYTEYALIMGQSEIGYKRYFPTVTLYNQTIDGVGEKKVSRELWDKIENGDTVSVTFQEGLFGYTNILNVMRL